MPAVARQALLRRELSAARHIPYAAQVAEHLVRTLAGDYVQVLRFGGASFESADDVELNNWHERLNVTWRNIAGPNVALWAHLIRRREGTALSDIDEDDFAGALASKYQRRLAGETLMVNDLYLSIVYRPVTGAAPSLLAKALARGQRGSVSDGLADTLDVCEKLGQTLLASFARYEAERLSVYPRQGRSFSRLLEFLGVLVNGEWQPMPLPRAPLNEVLATTRPLFGT